MEEGIEEYFPRATVQFDALLQSEFLRRLAIFGVVLVVAFVASKIVGVLIWKWWGTNSPKGARQARRFSTWLIMLGGILVGLEQLGLELNILLVIVTIGGIMLAIGLRDVLSSIASHEAIVASDPFKIGDWIQINGIFGRVVDVTLMDTILMTPDNETVFIPNSKITRTIVINRTTPGGTRISVPITVDSKHDLAEVEKILLEIGTELSEELVPETKPEVRATSIDSHSVRLALLLRINNPARGRLIASEVRKRAKKRLDKIRIRS